MLNALNERKMLLRVRPYSDHASFYSVELALVLSMLASDGSVGRDTPIAERDEPQVSDGEDPVAEDPGEVVHDKRGAERAQRFVVDRNRDSPGSASRREAEQNEEWDEGKTTSTMKRRSGSHGHGATEEKGRSLSCF